MKVTLIIIVSIVIGAILIDLEGRHRKRHHHHKHHHKEEKTDLIVTLTSPRDIPNNNSNFKTTNMNVKQWADANLQLIDHNTLDPIAATFTNIVMASDDSTIASVDTDVNADGNPDIVGVAVGKTILHFTADASYIDGNTQQPVTKSKSVDLNVEISEPLPGDEDTDLVVTLTPAQGLPTTA